MAMATACAAPAARAALFAVGGCARTEAFSAPLVAHGAFLGKPRLASIPVPGIGLGFGVSATQTRPCPSLSLSRSPSAFVSLSLSVRVRPRVPVAFPERGRWFACVPPEPAACPCAVPPPASQPRRLQHPSMRQHAPAPRRAFRFRFRATLFSARALRPCSASAMRGDCTGASEQGRARPPACACSLFFAGSASSQGPSRGGSQDHQQHQQQPQPRHSHSHGRGLGAAVHAGIAMALSAVEEAAAAAAADAGRQGPGTGGKRRRDVEWEGGGEAGRSQVRSLSPTSLPPRG
ncbi:hypothetical protein PLESTF_001114300 [Pleodorina starrii]|nr:hypothetical protein PLESTF_001114300 [Pleodorina starrii]